jgi:hypothetical protein
MSSHSRTGGRMRYVTLPIYLRQIRHACEGCVQRASEWLEESIEDLQDGKLARSHEKDGGKHEANADSKQGQGCEQKTAEDKQPVPPAHCEYWSARISMAGSRTGDGNCCMRNSFAQEPPICHTGHGAQPAQSAGEQMTGSCFGALKSSKRFMLFGRMPYCKTRLGGDAVKLAAHQGNMRCDHGAELRLIEAHRGTSRI